MRIVSGLIRMITGLAIMAMAVHVYLGHQTLLQGEDPVTLVILGQELTATPPQIIIGLIVAGAVGGLIELFGIFTLVRKPRPAPEPAQPPA